MHLFLKVLGRAALNSAAALRCGVWALGVPPLPTHGPNTAAALRFGAGLWSLAEAGISARDLSTQFEGKKNLLCLPLRKLMWLL